MSRLRLWTMEGRWPSVVVNGRDSRCARVTCRFRSDDDALTCFNNIAIWLCKNEI